MKQKKSISKTKQTKDISCMCSVHMRLEPNKPCLGHGVGCPCSDFIALQKLKEDSGQADKQEEITIQSTQ